MLRYVGLLLVALLLACDGASPSTGVEASTDRAVDAAPTTRRASDRECCASGRGRNTATARCVEGNAM